VPCSFPPDTPTDPLLTPVPPLLLFTQLFPWTVWIALVPLPPLSSWVLPLIPPSCCLSTSFCSPQVPCSFGASDLVSGDEVPIPCLHVPHHCPSPRAVPASLADSDDDDDDDDDSVFFTHVCSALCDSDDEVFILHHMLSCLSYPSHPSVRPRPAPQACGRGRCRLGYVDYRFARSKILSVACAHVKMLGGMCLMMARLWQFLHIVQHMPGSVLMLGK
jgi:hypothetical protein